MSYRDTRASVGQAEVTVVTSPLFFTVRYDGKTALLAARPAPTVVPTTQAKTNN
jgi:hypothetical protein